MAGNSGRIKGPNFDFKANGYLHRRSLMTYIGEFSQPVDGTCYPVDVQTVSFTLQLPRDWAMYWRLNLFCKIGSDCVAYDDKSNILEKTDPSYSSNSTVQKIVMPQHNSSVGFKWSSFACSLSSGKDSIVCSTTGTRYGTKKLINWIIPGAIMLVVGFSSVCMPISLKMPRVATTMIAMLTFVNKANSAFSSLPSIGTSLIVEFYMLGSFSLCVNMLAHVIVFRYESLAEPIAEVTLAVGLFGTALALGISLAAKGCQQIGGISSFLLIVFAAVPFVGILALAVYKYRNLAKKAGIAVLKRRSDSAPGRHDDEEENEDIVL